MDPPAKKFKGKNWDDKESEVLLEEVRKEYKVLVSQLQNTVTTKKKREIWQRIADEVNAVGGNNRPVEACKKRWKDMKSAFLKKPCYHAGTGGGKPAPPVPFEDVIEEIIGTTNLTNGIQVGESHQAESIEHHEEDDSQLSSSFMEESKPQNINLKFEEIEGRPLILTQTQQLDEAPVEESVNYLNRQWLKSAIEKNEAQTEVALLKKQKLILEIRMLKQNLETSRSTDVE